MMVIEPTGANAALLSLAQMTQLFELFNLVETEYYNTEFGEYLYHHWILSTKVNAGETVAAS